MASTASFSPSPQAHTYSSTWPKPSKLSHKFLFSSASNRLFFKPSLSSSTPFPLSLKPPSDPVHSHLVRDSVQDNFVENSMNLQLPIREFHLITSQDSPPRIFIQTRRGLPVQVVQAAVHIGMAIEQEVRIHSFLEKTKNFQRKKTAVADEDSLSKEKEILRKRVNVLIKRKRLREVQRLLVKEEIKPWGRDTQAKLGSRLIELLTETAYVQPPLNQLADGPPDVRSAFRHRFKAAAKSPGQKLVKNYGVKECDSLVLTGLDKTAKHMLIPYVPMLVPPRKWKGYDKGGHLFLPPYVMRTHGSRSR